MKRIASKRIARDIRLSIVTAAACLLLLPAGVYAQNANGARSSVPCTVTGLRFAIVTADDDLRGGRDNLNIIIYLANGRQVASNVNKNQEWQNDTVNTVDIALDQPVPLATLRAFRLVHVPDNVFTIDVGQLLLNPAAPINLAIDALQSPDKWNMASLAVSALGNGDGARVATHGYHSFAPSDPALTVYAHIPANSCELEERYGRLNPAAKTVQKASGAASKYGNEQRTSATPLPSKPTLQQLRNNKLIQQAMAHTVQIGPRASAPEGDAGYSALIGLLHKQSAAARSLLVPAVKPPNPNRTLTGSSSGSNETGTLLNPGTTSSLNPQPLPPKASASGGSSQMLLNRGTTAGLNPQPYPPKGSQPQISAEQTMSASGTQSAPSSANPTATQVNPPSGPTAHQPPAGRQPQPLGARTPAPITTICRSGIATVDGAANGVWFSPVAGEDGRFVIQGCGFGSMPGEVYLSGVQFDPAHAKLIVQHLGATNSPDRVSFTIPPNQWKGEQQFVTSWSDRQIVAQIDPNASGLYDTNNVVLNVKTASGQVYQAQGMNFLAARADQVLKGLPLPLGCTPQDTGPGCFPPEAKLDNVTPGKPPFVDVESPSLDMPKPGETIGVSRYYGAGDQFPIPMTPGHSFPGGTDAYQLNLAPGFQLDPHTGVNLSHFSIDVGYCQSMNGVYSKSGDWALNYTSKTSFQISWQEEACWPKTIVTSGNYMDFLNYASVSGYELEITVLGPRGVSPWASGNGNGLAIKQLQPVQMLHKN